MISMTNSCVHTFLLLFILYSTSMKSQYISATVVDAVNVPINNATIILKNIEGEIINYEFSDNAGKFSINHENDNIYKIEIKKYGYEDLLIDLNEFEANSIYKMDRMLVLDEFVVKAKAYPLRIKRDTTSYDVENFRDGTENTLEDILKKLPGLSVSENGGSSV